MNRRGGSHWFVTKNRLNSYYITNNTKGCNIIMNSIFLFLNIFFCIIGVVKTMSLVYTFVVKRIYSGIFKKDEKDVKIWMKP